MVDLYVLLTRIFKLNVLFYTKGEIFKTVNPYVFKLNMSFYTKGQIFKVVDLHFFIFYLDAFLN